MILGVYSKWDLEIFELRKIQVAKEAVIRDSKED
jgi:hypothetical protein